MPSNSLAPCASTELIAKYRRLGNEACLRAVRVDQMRVVIRDGERLVDVFDQPLTKSGGMATHSRDAIVRATVRGYKVEITTEPKCFAVRVEILRCQHCPKLAVSIGDGKTGGKRITGHKCQGAWTTIFSERVNPEDIIKAISDACVAQNESLEQAAGSPRRKGKA